MTTRLWLTNDPKDALALKAADNDYLRARDAARDLPLDEKIVAYREAERARLAAYDNVMKVANE
jgi:hypothetical protein